MAEDRPDILGAIKGRITSFLTRYPETKGQKPVAPAAPLINRRTTRPFQEIQGLGPHKK